MGKKQITTYDPIRAKFGDQITSAYQDQSLSIFAGSLEHLPNGVIVVNGDGTLINYNQLAVDMMGGISVDIPLIEWPQKYGLYKNNGKTIFPADELPLLRALNGEVVEGIEFLRRRILNHDEKWITSSAKPLKSVNGRIIGAILFLNDITAYKLSELRYEKKIQQIEAAFELQKEMAEIGNEPLTILNKVVAFAVDQIGDGCIAALLNLPADKLRVVAFHHIKPSARKLLYSSIISQEFGYENAIQNVIKTGEPLLRENVEQDRLNQITKPIFKKYIKDVGLQSFLVVPIKGRNRILGTLTLIRDRNGSLYTIEDQNFLNDIAYRTGLAIDNNYLHTLLRMESSGRRSAEEALELSEARFRSIFTSTALGIKLLDLEGRILETNPAFQKAIGYSEDELRGTLLFDYWHPDDVKYLLQVLSKMKDMKADNFQLEHRLISKDRSIQWMNVSFTGIKKNDREESLGFIVAISENITQRKRIEAEMAKMKSRLQSHVELERLRLAQELHDGPLQDLYSAVYKIENWGNSSEPVDLDRFDELKQDLLNIVEGLRNTAKDLRPPALTDFGLEKAIRSHAEEFQENHPEINIQFHLAHDGKILPEDIRLILFRIYQHSLTNVLRHAEACNVNIKFSFDAEEARIEIQDNGNGFVVPTNWMELVRQGHYGLAGAVERVSLLNGTFTVDSTPGEGTTVRVVIPINGALDSNNEQNEEV